MSEHHDVQVRPGVYRREGTRYRAECSCGFDGRWFASRRDAENDADEHLDQIRLAES